MNINDLKPGSFSVVSKGLNVNDLPQGSFHSTPASLPITTPTGQSTPAPQSDNSFMSGANSTAHFLGIQKAGQGLATAGRVASGSINQTGDEEGQMMKDQQAVINKLQQLRAEGVSKTDLRYLQLLNFLKRNSGDSAVSQAAIDPGTQLSNKEVIGSFGNVAANIIGAGSIPGEGAATGVLSKGGASLLGSTAKTVGGRLLETGAKNAAFGAASGAFQGMNDNKSNSDIAKTAGTSAAIQGGIGVGMQGLSEFGKLLTSKPVTTGIMDKTIGTSKKIIQAGKSPAADIVEQGVPRTKVGFLNQAEKTIQDSNSKISEILKNNNTVHESAPILNEVKQNLLSVYKGALNESDVDEIIKNLPVAALRDTRTMDTESLNKLRQVIDNKYIGNAKWLNSGNASPERITALKMTANTLRDIVQSAHPDLPGIFQDYSKAITQKTILSNELAKPHVLTNLIEAAMAAGGGLSAGGLSPKAGIEGLAGFAAIKTLLSTPVQSGLAIGLDRAGKLPSTAVGQGARALGRLTTQRAVQNTNK